jgi:hypothetical protein
MKKTKAKTTKIARTKSTKKSTGTVHASEHEFIIITGGGLVILMITMFFFLQ